MLNDYDVQSNKSFCQTKPVWWHMTIKIVYFMIFVIDGLYNIINVQHTFKLTVFILMEKIGKKKAFESRAVVFIK